MRILLVQNLPHLLGYGGAIRSNRILLAQLAARGHECYVVARLAGTAAQLRAHVEAVGGEWLGAAGGSVRYRLAGVEGEAVPNSARLVRRIPQVAAATRPDWVIVPSDDPGAMALGAATLAAPDRIIYIAHTLQQLPFGPRAFYPSTTHTELVRRAAGVVAVSRAAQEHLWRWGALSSHLICPAVYGSGPFPLHEGTSVTMVNPCGYKGIDIFLGLADAFPQTRFLAVASWGTTDRDRRALAGRRNVEVIEAAEEVDEILERTRVMLVPSLWDETFGYTVVEAMLRGIPVLASAVGGLREAKLAVPYLLPVRPIERYDVTADPARPVPTIPPQDLAPWQATLGRLLSNDTHRRDLAARSRQAATAFVAGLDEGALETYLRDLAQAGAAAAARP